MLDPISIGLLMMAGAGAAVAWARRRRATRGAVTDMTQKAKPGIAAREKPVEKKAGGQEPAKNDKKTQESKGLYVVGDVLQHLGDEFWLAGELTLVREGEAAVRLYSAPERGAPRWVALRRNAEALWVLRADEALHAMGWPGTEVPLRGAMLRPVETGSCVIVATGELDDDWSGRGRYGLYRSMENVALVLEQNGRRMALSGKAVPLRLVEKLG